MEVCELIGAGLHGVWNVPFHILCQKNEYANNLIYML